MKKVFLSLNSRDRDAVNELASILRAHGVEVWIDHTEVDVGNRFQEKIEDALGKCDAFLACLGGSGLGPWQNEEIRIAINRSVSTGHLEPTIIPILLPSFHGDESAVLPFLSSYSCLRFERAMREEEPIRKLLKALTADVRTSMRDNSESTQAHRSISVPRFHYGGVVPPDYFIGREEELRKAAEILHTRQSFLIAGPRRAGKTSFCRKLIHSIMQREGNASLVGTLNLESCSNLTEETFFGHSLLVILGEIARQVFRCKFTEILSGTPKFIGKSEMALEAFRDFQKVYEIVVRKTHQSDALAGRLVEIDFNNLIEDLMEIIRPLGWNQFVIIYDEANRLPEDISAKLVKVILMHSEALAFSNISGVYVASPELVETFVSFKRYFGHHIPLGPFPCVTKVRELLMRYYSEIQPGEADPPVSEDAITAIWKASDGFPYRIQLLLGYSFRVASGCSAGIVDSAHVDKAIRLLREEKPEACVGE